MGKLTLQKLKEMKPGVFARGEIIDNPEGINITNSGLMLRWVAVRGKIHDWCIYCHYADKDFDWIKRMGDKVMTCENIQKLVDCDEESLKIYRY